MNKKTKMPKRLLSVLLALAMVFCLLPISALAEGTSFPVNANYYNADSSSVEILNELKKAYPLTLPEAIPGETYTLKLPEKMEYTIGETTYTLERVKLMVGGPEIGTLSREWTIPLGEEESMTMDIPADGVKVVAAYYYWSVSGGEPTDPEEPGGRPGIVTNVINSLTRTVAQKEKELSYKTQYGMDIYRVESKNDLTLTYSADMDMTKLGSSFFGANSWETLQKHWTEIKDATWVDLHFQFDKEVTITDDALAKAKLESDMFSEKFNEDGSNQWWTITGKELILHCKWDSDKAKASMEADGKLNPMIELTGVKVALPDDWGDKDTIVIRNHGYVDGKVWARLEGATNDEWADIDGGEKDDEFVLTTSDKVSLPGLEKKIIEDGEEKDNTSVNVGAPITFQLKSNVPEDLKELIEYTGNGTHDKVDVVGTIPEGEEYTLTFHDKMNSAFVVPEYFLVYLGDDMLDQTKLLELNKDYQVNFDLEDCTFEIQLDLVKLYNEGIIKDEDLGKTSITVSYNTKLKDTVTNGTFENEAWVTAGEWETSHDVVTVDTYQIAVKKYETNHPNEEKFFLDGAVFGLYKDEACTEQIAKKTTGEVEKGFVYFSGLEAGTYYLKELQAPEGYVCSSEVVEIVVSEESDGENIVHVSFANSLIPHTGGMGTTIFSIVGGVLIAMAGTVFVISRRKRRA